MPNRQTTAPPAKPSIWAIAASITRTQYWIFAGLGLLTPHMASAASDSVIAQQIVTNVQRVQAGLAPQHAINRTLAY